MDPIKLRKFCEEECVYKDNQLFYKNQHIKALVVVHVFGNLADMPAIMEIAGTYGIKVIEDATEALGSKYTEGILAHFPLMEIRLLLPVVAARLQPEIQQMLII